MLKEEAFARTLFAQSKDAEWHIQHCQRVEECCALLAKGKNADKSILKQAAWLHDIGRTINGKNHPVISAQLAEKEFGKLDPRLKDAIVNHGTENEPSTLKGKIVQLADKLSVLSFESFIEDAKDNKADALHSLKKLVAKIEELVPRFDF